MPIAWSGSDGNIDEASSVILGLDAAIVSVAEEDPQVLVVRPRPDLLAETDAGPAPDALPFGPFRPGRHRTLAEGLRAWVAEQTNLKLGYVEQLYTFGDRGRDRHEMAGGPPVVSVVYLALVRAALAAEADRAQWRCWYRYFPWEDWREGRPRILEEVIEPALWRWVEAAGAPTERREREYRIDITFGLGPSSWNEELALERYELLYESGLVFESLRDRNAQTRPDEAPATGQAMVYDHRRILATAMGRLRGKIKYRPVVFELMPATFTLFQLQRTVEALAGQRLHKQNFRRLVEKTGLVERTGVKESHTGGRPAEQFRFRPDVLLERPAAGVKIPGGRKG